MRVVRDDGVADGLPSVRDKEIVKRIAWSALKSAMATWAIIRAAELAVRSLCDPEATRATEKMVLANRGLVKQARLAYRKVKATKVGVENEPTCPDCGGKMNDNRELRQTDIEARDAGTRTAPARPAFKCMKKRCEGAIWESDESKVKVNEA